MEIYSNQPRGPKFGPKVEVYMKFIKPINIYKQGAYTQVQNEKKQ